MFNLKFQVIPQFMYIQTFVVKKNLFFSEYQIKDLLEAFKIDMVVEKYGEQNKDTTQLHKTLHYVKIQVVKKTYE